MNKSGLYPKLAYQNIKNNRKFYIPYMLTGMGVAMMFYTLLFLAFNPGLIGSFGGRTITMFLTFGSVIVGIFSVVLLFYTNSFLMKRRKKELGIFIILGMEKRHLALVQFFETIYVSVISTVFGLLLGVGFSRLTLSLLTKLAHINTPLRFSVDIKAVLMTLALFLVVYLVIFLFNIISVGRAKPIDVLKGGNVGEKEPKTKWVLTIIGILALGGGYAIALLTKDPMSAIMLFFFAVLLVIIGTYLLFTTGSITILKGLKENKDCYYKTNHFINVSGMVYRMKQNAVGLGNICILSTMVLVMISTTVALNIGAEDILDSRYPHQIALSYHEPEEDTLDTALEKIQALVQKEGVGLETLDYDIYFSFGMNGSSGDLSIEGVEDGEYSDYTQVTVISAEEYDRKTGEKAELAPGQALVSTWNLSKDSQMQVFGVELTKVGETGDVSLSDWVSEYESYSGCYIRLVVSAEDYGGIIRAYEQKYEDSFGNNIDIHLDTDLPEARQEAFYTKLMSELAEKHTSEYTNEDGTTGTFEYYSISSKCRAADSQDLYSMYGGFLFLGISLGLMFIMATILIVYYKQITEGYNDRERFIIMQKVGLSKSEIKKSIHSQIVTVFFLPLLVAVLHVAIAFSIITKLLAMLEMTNIGLFVICTGVTVGVFALIYLAVYLVTAREYYKIVSQ